MTTRRISRRTVLRGLGATVALPLLDVMRPVSALGGGAAAPGSATAPGAAASARRLACFYFPNGIARGTWHPAETGPDGRLTRRETTPAPRQGGAHARGGRLLGNSPIFT